MTTFREPKKIPVRKIVVIPAAIALYAVIIHWVYRDTLAPLFGYAGYEYQAPSHPVFPIAVWLITVIAGWFLPARISKPSSLILWVLFTVMLAPSLLLSPYIGSLSEGRSVAVSCGLALAFIAVCLGVHRSKPAEGFLKRPSATTFWLVVIGFSGFVYAYLAITAGLSFRFHSFEDVYDIRSEYVNELEAAGLLGYLVSTQANVVNPLIMARGIHARKPVILLVGALMQLVLYSVTGFKTILLSMAAIAILVIIFRRNAAPRGAVFLWGASGVVVVAAAVDAWRDSIIWTSLFTRRFLVTPGRLSNLYFEFYGDKPAHMLSGTAFIPKFNNDYEYGPSRTISLWVTGSETTSMNANFFANGFSQFHWAGVFGAALILIVYLRVLDRAAVGIPVSATALIVVMPAITLSNTAIYTAMLSHGLVVALICLALCPLEGWDRKPKNPKLKKSWRGSSPRNRSRMVRI